MACGNGQRERVGTELNRKPWGRLGCPQERVEVGRGLWWGVGGQAQMGENLDDHGGISSIGHNVTNGYIEAYDRSRAVAVFNDCPILQMDESIRLMGQFFIVRHQDKCGPMFLI